MTAGDTLQIARRIALTRAFSRVLGGFPLTPDESDEILRELDAAAGPALDAAQTLTLNAPRGWKPSDGYTEPTPAVAAVLHPAQLCCCIGGVCRHEVVDGRCANGDHCRAHMTATLQEDVL